MRVSVIIPTYNEAQAIGHVLADLPAELVTEVVVVDSHSTDGTPDVARKMGAQVIEEPRRGYGRACLTGLANTESPDVVVFLDGDYSDRPSELPIVLAPIIEGRADIVLGSRFSGKNNSRSVPWHQWFGNRLAAGLIRLFYGVRVSDLGPFRAARADLLRVLELEETTYGWAVEMILKAAIAGFRIVEVPVSYYPRIGKSKISGTVKGTIGAAWFILSRIVGYYFRRPRAGTPRPAQVPRDQSPVKFSSQAPMVSSHPKRTLVVMAKAPRPGLVKTRLIESLPSLAVTALYRCLLEDTLALAKSLTGVEVAVMCPEPDQAELARLFGNAVRVVAQKGDGLAAGLTSVFRHFAAAGQHVIAFNSDSPHLAPSVLHSAFEILERQDVVVGPTDDGGYYLVGAKAAHPSLFEGDGMGTQSAFDRLLTRATALRLSTGFTQPFYDIDVPSDLILLARELRLAPERAPRTAEWFKEWDLAVAELHRGTSGA